MKFCCEKKVLHDAIHNVSLAISVKSTNAVLEGILLECKNNTLTLTGYNLDMGIITSISVEDAMEGTVVLHAGLLSNIIAKMPEGNISVLVDERHMTVVKGGEAEFTILGFSAMDYPEIPAFGTGQEMKLDADLLKNMLGQTLFAVAQSDQKPVLMGTLFHVKEGSLRCVSVDGFRLALKQEYIGSSENEEFRFIVPGKTLNELQKLLIKWSSSDQENTDVTIHLAEKHIIFECFSYRIFSRTIEGEFLDYQNSIPQDAQTEIVLSTQEWLESISRVSIVIQDRAKSPVKCEIEQSQIKLSCETAMGKVHDIISCQATGELLQLAFNHKYMQDALKASESDKVRMICNGTLSPIKIVPFEGDDFLFLILPVRLK